MDKKENTKRLGQIVFRSLSLEVAVTLLLMLVAAVLISEEVLPFRQERGYVCLILGISAVIGSYSFVKAYTGKKVMAALLNAAMMSAVWIIICLTEEGRANGLHYFLVFATSLTGSIIGCVLAVSSPKRRKGR